MAGAPMIYVIGGNRRIAEYYCQNVLHLGTHDSSVRVFSVMNIVQGPGLLGHRFHPGDVIYEVGLDHATGKEIRQVEEQIDVCLLGLTMKVEIITGDVLVMTVFGTLEDEEMREIEELRRKLKALQ